ncbi:glycosyltransferase family 4 protein [Thermoanaerobacterium thermosaccharolyticum]|uniref:glycosyltransferase family 4 protein n=1 Tax=Thermoanaerobacterium thermosaccharolyticum TaxID=1517 RepID=UPI00177B6834|nr:glycosyltransferase family 1 protein [Thermoanaerobacterium thermosaccharolyticum]MBE0069262.1 glycosyltransferase family 4 protein [Thermoanaerobacterium thermosaccharolyticum]MBE0229048.1 glycosyltransferase family 4 protein [Thermoanaerobacterium thermosaccharolyticum]
MNISVDILPILDPQKTGVGWYTYNIIKYMALNNDIKKYKFEFLGFDFLGRRNNTEVKELLKEWFPNSEYKIFKMMPYGIYRRIWDYIPFSYNYLFNSKSNLYNFFNFIVPQKINGYVINTVYDMVYKVYPNTMTKANYKRLDKELARSCERADLIITISNNSKQEIINYLGISGDKIRIVPCGVDLNFYKPVYKNEILNKYNIQKPYFLYIGTLEPRKNIKNLILAFNDFLKKNNCNDVKLVIGGKKGWMYEEIFKTVQELKLENDIIFLGYVPIEDMSALYSNAVSFIFPSLYEGFGIPPLEAMACGCPVIVSNTSSLPEVVGDAGILINPFDVEELSNAMYYVYCDNDLRNELKKKSIIQAGKFSWELAAQKIIDIYKEFE